ncbi:MAG: hypothetical protein Q8J85_06355, partial [Sulfuricurvum sp.]|nr:hypothetical protein [Sulfuricurvum sp.]MDP3021593.1 hypothetical protein [Sulfuricurvum sp.]
QAGVDAINAGMTLPAVSLTATDSSTPALTATDSDTPTYTAQNDAPSGTDKTVTINEDTAYVLKQSDFGFSDIDGNTFMSVIVNLPSSGKLYFDGIALSSSATISVMDIDAGKLVYLPDLDASGAPYGSFSFQVKDNGGTANGGIDTDQTANSITFNVTPIADPISNPSDVSVVVGSPTEKDTINLTSLNGVSSLNFANGVTLTSGSGDPFTYSTGSTLGIKSANGDNRIEGGESIILSSVNGIQYVAIGLKNSSDDTVKFTGQLEVAGLGFSGTLSGTLTSTLSTTISSANADFKLVLTFTDGTSTVIINDIVIPGTGSANWSIAYDAGTKIIASATLISLVNGNIFNQGGNASANMTFSISSDMSSFAIAQGAGTENIYNQNNNGFQIEYLETSVSQNGVSYSYPIDVYALVKDTVGSPETITALKLSDIPSGSQMSVLVDGTYVEVVATNGVFDLSPYTNLLTSSTAVSGTDKIYLTTSLALPDGFVPTMTIQTTDNGSTSLTILGGTTDSTLIGGDGNDYISGGAGRDTLDGGAGNDTLVMDAADVLIDGGTGTDTLILTAGTDINFANLGDIIKNIEIIDLGAGTEAGGNHSLTNLSLQDVIDMTDSNNNLIILGDAGDTVDFLNSNGWVKGTSSTEIVNGSFHTLDHYTNTIDPTVLVKVETLIQDTI